MTDQQMSHILVCVKRVPDTSGQVLLTDDGQAVDARYVGFTISAHEEAAIELAIQAAAATGGDATVLTLGAPEAIEQVRSALALGVQHAVQVEADPGAYGPADVAREIAAVVRAHEAEGRRYDLVLLGNDAADSGDHQVGIRLAYELGWPVVNGQATVALQADQVTTTGDGPEGQETYAVPTPAVVTVLEGGVEPRYPTVSGRMKAKKVAIENRAPAHPPEGSRRVTFKLPPPTPSNVISLGKGPSAAAAVVDLFDQLGVGR